MRANTTRSALNALFTAADEDADDAFSALPEFSQTEARPSKRELHAFRITMDHLRCDGQGDRD